jgi:hypothetical protein
MILWRYIVLLSKPYWHKLKISIRSPLCMTRNYRSIHSSRKACQTLSDINDSTLRWVLVKPSEWPQGSFGLCGSRVAHQVFCGLRIRGAETCERLCWRSIRLICIPAEKRNAAWQPQGGPSEWFYHRRQSLCQEPPANFASSVQVKQNCGRKSDTVWGHLFCTEEWSRQWLRQ